MSEEQLDLAKRADGLENTLSNLPLKELFGAPFKAAFDAQESLALTTAKFIKNFSADASGNMFTFTTSSYYDLPAANVKNSDGNQVYYLYHTTDANIPSFDVSGVGVNLNKSRTANGGLAGQVFTNKQGTWDVSGTTIAIDSTGRIVGSQGQRSLTLPFISILNIPALSITDVNVEFKMEIKTQSTNTTSQVTRDTSVDVSVKEQWWGRRRARNTRSWEVAVTTAVATSNAKSVSETNTSSIYVVKMGAKSRTPVGLTMMLDFITNNASDGAAKMEMSDDGYSTKPSTRSSLLDALAEVELQELKELM